MLTGFSDEYLIAVGCAWLGVILSAVLAVHFQPWRSHRPWPVRATKVGLGVWTTFTLALVLETAFAFCYDTTDSFGLCRSTKRWYARHVHYNNMGFRDRKDFSCSRAPGRRRIVLLGDSFAFGHGIADPKDRFGDLLEAKCVAASGGTWELDNMSEPGLSTGLMLERLHQLEADNFKMDVLLLAYNLNDLEDLHENSRYIVGTIILDQPPGWVLRECYLPNFLYYRAMQFSRPEVRGYFNWLSDAYTGEVWRKQRKRLDSVRAWCRRRNVQLLVVTFPFLNSLDHNYAFVDAHARLADYWRSAGVPALDLLNVLRPHAAEGLTVNRFDAHPNERAHAIAANALWERLFKSRVSAGAARISTRDHAAPDAQPAVRNDVR